MKSVPILSQVVKIKMKVQVSNPHGLWLYLSDTNPIIKQWEKVEEKIKKLEVWNLE